MLVSLSRIKMPILLLISYGANAYSWQGALPSEEEEYRCKYIPGIRVSGVKIGNFKS